MSEVMGLADQAGVVEGELAFKKVGENIEKVAGVYDDLPKGVREAGWISQHFVYGTAAGLLYSLAESRLRFDKGYAQTIPAGIVFGALLWVIGFAGWVPLAKLYPSPDDQTPRKAGMILGAHAVYGVATAIAYRMLRLAP